MGQYHIVINEDKKEYIEAHRFGEGIKLMEFTTGGCGTLTGLALLLADKTANGKGNGDFGYDGEDILGRWHGDRIKIVGDYGDDGLYKEAFNSWTDISKKVLAVMLKDVYVREQQEGTSWRSLEERLEEE